MHGKFDELGRFADPSVLILTSLSDGAKHGYAVMTDVAAFSGVAMEPGTLYGALSRLEKRGWIRPLDSDERRRPYQITAAGSRVLTDSVEQMRELVLELAPHAPRAGGARPAERPGDGRARGLLPRHRPPARSARRSRSHGRPRHLGAGSEIGSGRHHGRYSQSHQSQ